MTAMHIIEISKKDRVPDAEGLDIVHGVADLKIAVRAVRVIQVYILEGALSGARLKRIAENILVDPVIEDYKILKMKTLPVRKRFRDSEKSDWSVLKTFHHGVTDNVGMTALEAIRNLGTAGVESVSTGKRYLIAGPLAFGDARKIADRLLANPLIESCVIEKLRV
jgi:phosphoribosylformylglycinamidine (FGAM) synthase PurS component